MKDWYKDWFASDYYLKVYSHRNDKDATNLIELIKRNIQIDSNAKILDAACGNGRHSLQFAKLGYNVVGFDLSKQLLEIACQNKMTNVNYFRSDIRSVPLKRVFDLILNLFTSFGYFESDVENFNFIKFASSHLTKNGYFIFDYLNPNYVKNNLVQSSSKNIGKLSIEENRKIVNNRVEKEIIISDENNLHRYFESVRLYSLSQILSMFLENEFVLYKSFGNYSGDDYDEEQSKRMILFFRKT